MEAGVLPTRNEGEKASVLGAPEGPPWFQERLICLAEERWHKRGAARADRSTGAPHSAEMPTWIFVALGLISHGYSVNTC